MATPTAPPNTPKTTTSVDPLYKLATAQAKSALAAETSPITAEQGASDAYFKQRSTDAGANAAALSSLLKGIGPAVGDTYETAAQNQTLAADGFSHGMQDALQGHTDNLNAMLEKLGAPTRLDSHAAEAGDVAYGKGYYPALALRSSGAALQAAADELPGTALLRGQENQKQIGIQSASAHAGFDAKIAELAGKLPGDIEANYSKLQSLALSNARFREQIKNDKFNQAYKLASQKLQVAKYNTSVDEFNARQALSYKKLAVQESQFAQRQVNSDRSYALSLAHLGIAQKGLQLRVAAAAFKQAHGGYTTAQVKKFDQKLDALVAAGAPTRPVQTTIKGKDGSGDSYTDTGMNTPTPQYQDKSGKWHDITPTTAVPSGARTRNGNTYANFVKAALKKGVPIQLALQRADTIWPETQRTLPESLKNLPQVAAEAAQQAKDYKQMTGATLGTSPSGTPITYSAPKNLSAAGKKAVGSILNLASEYLGTPYAWGGGGPNGPSRGTAQGANTIGFDCSSFAEFLYAKQGISIPRTTYDQFKTGLSVPSKQLQAGDLVFFQGSDGHNGLPGHVGVYIGGGKFVEAPHTGDVVKISNLSGYPGYMGARRYVH